MQLPIMRSLIRPPRTTLRLTVLGAVQLGVLAISSGAAAQYKNSALGLDAGGWLIMRPSAHDENGNLLDPSKRPVRISHGLRVGGEGNYKLDEDHLWLTVRVNMAFLRFRTDEEFDRQASDAMGTLLGIEAGGGLRYVFLTDYTRPYLQIASSYLRLQTLASTAGNDCGIPGICDQGGSNVSNFLPHPNIWAVHLQPGIEFIVSRDIALHLYADLQRWIVFNATDNHSVVVGLGVNFFI